MSKVKYSEFVAKYIISISRLVQVLISIQMVLIYLFNIPSFIDSFNFVNRGTSNRLLMMFGILYVDDS